MARDSFEFDNNKEPKNEGRIRVVVTGDPGSNPPDWVRISWLGVEFDASPACNPFSDYRSSPELTPIETTPSWEVPACEAIDALFEYGQDAAANWWISNGFYEPAIFLAFPINSCVPIDGQQVVFPDLN